jgi:hypothetical protein
MGSIAQVSPAAGKHPYKDGETQIQQTFIDTFGRIVFLQDLFKTITYIIPDCQ